MNLDIENNPWQSLPLHPLCDLVCADPPYSPKTHTGHDAVQSSDARQLTRASLRKAPLTYPAWEQLECDAFARACVTWSRGWIAIMHDHMQRQWYEDALLDCGLWVAQPIPVILSGMTVRLCGGGPSSEAVWLTVARHRTKELAAWRTTRGYYSGPAGKRAVIGGKPDWLPRRIIADYSDIGGTVLDPCFGGGSTLRAALELGRHAIGRESDSAHYAVAVTELAKVRRLDITGMTRATQPKLF